MTLIASKVCEYIRPDSSTDSDAENYEYYLVWLGVDGGVYVVNTKSENITKLFKNANQSINIIAEDLTENEFDVIADITRALVVKRYFRDGTSNNLAIITDKIIKPKSQFRYNLELEVSEIEDKVMR